MFAGEPLGRVSIAPLQLQLPHLFICVATAQLDVEQLAQRFAYECCKFLCHCDGLALPICVW